MHIFYNLGNVFGTDREIFKIPQFEAKEKYLKLRNKKNTLSTLGS